MGQGLKRICLHWTGGTGKANETDKKCYHYLVEADGKVIKGKYSPEDNINCNDGKYAAHTGGGNTGSIGIALCGMFGYSENKPEATKHPLNQVQCEACWKLIAELCHDYSIEVSEDTVLTHWEFNKKYPKANTKIKIDITYLSYQPNLNKNEVGNFIRNKVLWYKKRI